MGTWLKIPCALVVLLTARQAGAGLSLSASEILPNGTQAELLFVADDGPTEPTTGGTGQPGIATDGVDGYIDLATADVNLNDLRGGRFAIISVVQPDFDNSDGARLFSGEGVGSTYSPHLRFRALDGDLKFAWFGASTWAHALSGDESAPLGTLLNLAFVSDGGQGWGSVNGQLSAHDASLGELAAARASLIRLGAAAGNGGGNAQATFGAFFLLDLTRVWNVNASFAQSLATAVNDACLASRYDPDRIREAIIGVHGSIRGVYWKLDEASTAGNAGDVVIQRYDVATGQLDALDGGITSTAGCVGAPLVTSATPTDVFSDPPLDPNQRPTFVVASQGYEGNTPTTRLRVVEGISLVSRSETGTTLQILYNLDAPIYAGEADVELHLDGGDDAGLPTTNSSELDYPKVIARWATPPYQTYTGRFVLDVVAFCANPQTPGSGGIERVSIQVTDSSGHIGWIAQSTTTEVRRAGDLGPAASYHLFQFALDADRRSDGQPWATGPATVRFTAFPEIGDARALRRSGIDDPADLPIYLDPADAAPRAVVYLDTNDETSLETGTRKEPAKSLPQAVKLLDVAFGGNGVIDGGVIYVKQGFHADGLAHEHVRTWLGNNSRRWLTIAGDPEAWKRPVIGGQRKDLDAQLVRYQGGEFFADTAQPYPVIRSRWNGGQILWIDDCELGSDNHLVRHKLTSGYGGGIWVTDCYFHDIFGSALRNNTAHIMMRDTEIRTVGNDGQSFSGMNGMLLNVEIDGLHAAPRDDTTKRHHSDYVQLLGNVENTIFHHLKGVNSIYQGFNTGANTSEARMNNIAWVNCHLENWAGEGRYIGNLGVSGDHLLFWHCTFVGHHVTFNSSRAEAALLSNLSIRNSLFDSIRHYAAANVHYPDTAFSNCHVMNEADYGIKVFPGVDTTGGYLDLAADDGPSADTPELLGRVEQLLIPVDLRGRPWAQPGAIGAYELE